MVPSSSLRVMGPRSRNRLMRPPQSRAFSIGRETERDMSFDGDGEEPKIARKVKEGPLAVFSGLSEMPSMSKKRTKADSAASGTSGGPGGRNRRSSSVRGCP